MRSAKLSPNESGRLAALITDTELEIVVEDTALEFKFDNFTVRIETEEQ